MPVKGGRSFVQGCNCQAAVDEKAQVIVTSGVTRETNDKEQIEPVVSKLKENTGGVMPRRLSADSGYTSGANCEMPESEGIDACIAADKQ